MPLQLPVDIVRWLTHQRIIDSVTINRNQTHAVIPYNHQIYFCNGYLVAQLLRIILKAQGYSPQSLLKVRKIAHISSNQNWMIIQEIMQELHFSQEINPHEITIETVTNIVAFLYDHFADKRKEKQYKKQKNTFFDPQLYAKIQSLQQCNNLLQFLIFVLSRSLSISLSESLGLLIEEGKYLKQIVIYGASNLKYEPIRKMYQLVIQSIGKLNQLLSEQKGNTHFLMKCLILGIFSEDEEIRWLACVLIENAQIEEWLQTQGYFMMLRSPSDKCLDLLMKKLNPKFQIIFNEGLGDKFVNKSTQLQTYSKLINYLLKSMYSKQIFAFLPLKYYHTKATSLFQPDIISTMTAKQKIAAKKLLMNIVLSFWNKLSKMQRNLVCYTFESKLCISETQRIITLSYLFQMLKEISVKDKSEYVNKFYKIIDKYFAESSEDIRKFIMDNFAFMLKKEEQLFKYHLFLEGYRMAPIVQSHDYFIIQTISLDKFLKNEWTLTLVKICTVYYYQQLHASCFIQPLSNLAVHYHPLEWANSISQEILTKWPNLSIPSYQVLPPNTKKIKFRSVSFKKKEMIQFTQLNRYKNILTLLTRIKNKPFLVSYSKVIISAILKVQKSKLKEMQNTRIFLNSLLGTIDIQLLELKQEKLSESLVSYTSPTQKPSSLENKPEEDPLLEDYERYQTKRRVQKGSDDQYQDEVKQTPMNRLIQSSDNEFMNPQQQCTERNPLLPFTDQQLDDCSPKLYTEGDLFENYEIIYIKSIGQTFSSVIAFATETYQKSANVEHFLKTLNILNYFQKDMHNIVIIEEKLKHRYEDHKIIAQKLIIQLGLLMFQFKKNRRIMIKCLQSFYQLLIDKNQINNEKKGITTPQNQKQQDKILTIQAKLDFSYKFNNKIKTKTPALNAYILCFELVNDFFKSSMGINLIQPISKLVSQMKQKSPASSLKNSSIEVYVEDRQQKQLCQLQNMIDSQYFNNSKVNLPVKKGHSGGVRDVMKGVQVMSKEKREEAYEKWTEVQKKVIIRRKELQERARMNAKK